MYFMKKKRQAVKHVMVFIVIIKTHLLNLSFSHFCTDYKHKYLNLKNWFSSQSIIWELTVTYSSKKNDISEWVNCIIYELTRTMFKNSDMNSFLWSEVIKTAVILKNCLSTQCLKNKTFYEAWTDKKLNLDRLCIFNITAWTHILRNIINKKLSLKTEI